jgi:methylmalonyl-CoA mutase cobalamin-binding subunit
MTTTEQIQAAAALLDAPPVDVSALDDAALIALQTAIGDVSRAAARHAAVAAGELARRSSRDLGYAGVANVRGIAPRRRWCKPSPG